MNSFSCFSFFLRFNLFEINNESDLYYDLEYLRGDIPCMSEQCPAIPPCQRVLDINTNNPKHEGLLSVHADHYVIPDMSASIFLLLLLGGRVGKEEKKIGGK